LLAHAARAAFMSGNHLAIGAGALVAAAAALVVLAALPARTRDEHRARRPRHTGTDLPPAVTG
jgi:Flp pilus assembly protein TadB